MNTCYYVLGLLLMMVYFVVGTTTATIINCQEVLTCENQVIKFPFQIKNRQAPLRGYPGFDLISSSNNHTKL